MLNTKSNEKSEKLNIHNTKSLGQIRANKKMKTMDALIAIMAIGLIIFYQPLLLLAIFFLAIALIFFYLGQVRKGKVLVEGKENHLVAIERAGGKFVKFILTSKTYDFVGTGDENEKWKIKPSTTGPQTCWIKDRFGYDPVGDDDNMPDLLLASQAKMFKVNRNSHRVIRPKQKGDVLKYELHEDPIEGYNIPLFITHTFETSPINTMGVVDDPRNRQGEKMTREEEEQHKLKMVATVVELFQVQIKIVNPYLALYRTRDFMQNVNTTLQSGAREITAELGFLELIMAKTETEKEKGDFKGSSLARAFAEKLIGIVNGANSLAQYGIEIIDIDFLDHHLADPRVETALNDAQVESLKAVARDIRGKSKRDYDMDRAKGRAAEMSELIKASGNDKRVVLAEIDRRKLVDAVGAHKGTVLTLGGKGTPAIVDSRPQQGENKPVEKGDEQQTRQPNQRPQNRKRA